MAVQRTWRNLSASEIAQLREHGNAARDWRTVMVCDGFNADIVMNCRFYGTVFIGENVLLENVFSLSNYFIDDHAIIRNVFNLSCENVLASETFAFPVHIRNESGLRTIISFPDMTPADAYLASQYFYKSELLQKLQLFSREAVPDTFHRLGYVGKNVVLQNVKAVDSTVIEENALIVGCAELQAVWVHSSADEATKIGSNVTLNQVIVGYGSELLDGAIIHNSVLCNHVTITDVARITDCVVGDNSHISCCEVLNSLLFPFHEQHHNNSFLIASLLEGQSNIAAGSTIGSNHNGRKNDCELIAGRGFWPGLCTSVKFPSRFASFTLLAKADYPYCINLPLPFSLLSNNSYDDELEIRPAYWWRYNTFFLLRNEWKLARRDARIHKIQHINIQPIAPDTVQEILQAMRLMRKWKAVDEIESFTYSAQNDNDDFPLIELSSRNVRIVRPAEAYGAYYEMLIYYAVMTLLPYFCPESDEYDITKLLVRISDKETFDTKKVGEVTYELDYHYWENLGGQVVRLKDVRQIMEDVQNGTLSSWNAVHNRYDALYRDFDKMNTAYALWILGYLADLDHQKLTLDMLEQLYFQGVEIAQELYETAFEERDYDKDVARNFYDDQEEKEAMFNAMDADPVFDFIRQKQIDLTEITKRHVKL